MKRSLILAIAILFVISLVPVPASASSQVLETKHLSLWKRTETGLAQYAIEIEVATGRFTTRDNDTRVIYEPEDTGDQHFVLTLDNLVLQTHDGQLSMAGSEWKYFSDDLGWLGSFGPDHDVTLVFNHEIASRTHFVPADFKPLAGALHVVVDKHVATIHTESGDMRLELNNNTIFKVGSISWRFDYYDQDDQETVYVMTDGVNFQFSSDDASFAGAGKYARIPVFEGHAQFTVSMAAN